MISLSELRESVQKQREEKPASPDISHLIMFVEWGMLRSIIVLLPGVLESTERDRSKPSLTEKTP